MSEFFFRTEEIEFNELANLFSETEKDREIIDILKGRNTVLLIGSRGAGKSFLLRYAEFELVKSFPESRIFPVYISFMKSALLRTNDNLQFHNWMLCNIVVNTHKALMKRGVLAKFSPNSSYLTKMCGDNNRIDRIADVVQRYENSYLNPSTKIPDDQIPKIEEVKELLEELCEECKIKRFVLTGR